jgi:hypothetical protein
MATVPLHAHRIERDDYRDVSLAWRLLLTSCQFGSGSQLRVPPAISPRSVYPPIAESRPATGGDLQLDP